MFLLETLSENVFPYLSQPLEAVHLPWHLTPSCLWNTSGCSDIPHITSFWHCCSCLPLSPFNDSYDIGPTPITGIISYQLITDLHSICNLRITWPIHRFWTLGWPHLGETIAYTAYHHCLMWAYLRRMQGHKPNMGVSVIKVCIYIFHNSTCGDGSLACLDIVSNLPHTFFSPCFTTGKARLSHLSNMSPFPGGRKGKNKGQKDMPL